jgi:hypothetical protein
MEKALESSIFKVFVTSNYDENRQRLFYLSSGDSTTSEDILNNILSNNETFLIGLDIQPQTSSTAENFYTLWESIIPEISLIVSIEKNENQKSDVLFKKSSITNQILNNINDVDISHGDSCSCRTSNGLILLMRIKLNVEQRNLASFLTLSLSISDDKPNRAKVSQIFDNDELSLRSLLQEARFALHVSKKVQTFTTLIKIVNPISTFSSWVNCLDSCLLSITINNMLPRRKIQIRSIEFDLSSTQVLLSEAMSTYPFIIDASKLYHTYFINDPTTIVISPNENYTFMIKISPIIVSTEALVNVIGFNSNINLEMCNLRNILIQEDSASQCKSTKLSIVWSEIVDDNQDLRLQENSPPIYLASTENSIFTSSIEWNLKPHILGEFSLLVEAPGSAVIHRPFKINLSITNNSSAVSKPMRLKLSDRSFDADSANFR